MARPAAEAAPDVYRVAFENERLRLLEVRMAPGAKSELHSHPNYLAYVLSDGKVRLTDASGTAELELHEGDNLWREAEEHSAENVGTTELRALFIELK
jgi:quercetin dioxygenase-like cupin family protein